MIDVVFLLLVFFMLASRFGVDMHLLLNTVGEAQTSYSGPPRLVDILPQGVRLNGSFMESGELTAKVLNLTESSTDTVVLRSRDGASLQRIVDVMQRLTKGGLSTLVLVE